jgi:CheY-like chemotaxis protein
MTTSPPAVLVVDEAPSNLHVACAFCAAGYEVTAVAGTVQAARALEDHGRYALYVLDIELPGALGAAVAARIRQSQPDARILYLTTFSDALVALHGRLIPGREDLLEKPASNQKLLKAAFRLLFAHDTELDAQV